ncbi:MAG: hypothetical protein D6776_07145 [Planctomycetota bacterium]|nr:MAG: hypothetical protein D6776_07145 [Planctomycetota bacterium]
MTWFAVCKGWPRGCFRRNDRSGLQWGFPPADHDIVSRLQHQIGDWERVQKAIVANGNTEPIRLAQPIAVHAIWDGNYLEVHPPL